MIATNLCGPNKLTIAMKEKELCAFSPEHFSPKNCEERNFQNRENLPWQLGGSNL